MEWRSDGGGFRLSSVARWGSIWKGKSYSMKAATWNHGLLSCLHCRTLLVPIQSFSCSHRGFVRSGEPGTNFEDILPFTGEAGQCRFPGKCELGTLYWLFTCIWPSLSFRFKRMLIEGRKGVSIAPAVESVPFRTVAGCWLMKHLPHGPSWTELTPSNNSSGDLATLFTIPPHQGQEVKEVLLCLLHWPFGTFGF